MVGAHRFGRLDFAVGQSAQILHERKLMFGSVDFAPEQRGVCPVLFCLPKHLKGIEGSPRGSAKNAHDDRGIIANQLLKSRWAKIGDFEENWARADTGPGEQAGDTVVHKARKIGNQVYGSVRNKY